MKVKELIKILKQENPELEVALASDEEGNSFSLLDEGFGIYTGIRDEEKINMLCLFPDENFIDDVTDEYMQSLFDEVKKGMNK